MRQVTYSVTALNAVKLEGHIKIFIYMIKNNRFLKKVNVYNENHLLSLILNYINYIIIKRLK